MAEGRGGYGVALSIAELDPGFAAKPVLIAYRQAGRSLGGGRSAALNWSSPATASPGARSTT